MKTEKNIFCTFFMEITTTGCFLGTSNEKVCMAVYFNKLKKRE